MYQYRRWNTGSLRACARGCRQGLILAPILLALILVTGCGKDDTSVPTPITLEIMEPQEGAWILTDEVRVRGTATGVSTVEVDGRTVEVVGDRFEINLFRNDGEHTLTVIASSLQETVQYRVHTTPPRLVVEHPPRGHIQRLQDGDRVELRGQVTSTGPEIQRVSVGGIRLELNANGEFVHEIPLRQGLNTIQIEVTDEAGLETESIRGVVYGPRSDASSVAENALDLLVASRTFQEVADALASLITPETVSGFLSENVPIDAVSFESITFEPVVATLAPSMGRLRAAIELKDVVLHGGFRIGDTTFPARVSIDEARVTLFIRMQVVEGQLVLTIEDPEFALDPEDFHWQIDDFDETNLPTLRDLVVAFAQDGFAGFFEDLVLDALYDPDILIRRIEVLDRVLEFEVVLQSIIVDTDGIFARAGLSFPAQMGFVEATDALERSSMPAGLSGTSSFEIAAALSGLDRTMDAIWRSGLLHQELRGNDFAGFSLPFELTSDAISIILAPDLADVVPPNTPAGLRLRPLHPPVVDLSQSQGSDIALELADFIIDLVIFPAGEEELTAISMACYFDLRAGLIIEDTTLRFSFDVTLNADVDDSLVPINRYRTERLFEELAGQVPGLLAQSLELSGEADFDFVTLTSPQARVDGDRNQIVIAFDVVIDAEALAGLLGPNE